MIKETRLGALVGQHRSLAADVGALDSDMQTLVYENYNKFIVATDIIRAMDGAMEGLDSRLRQLENLIGGAVNRSETVNGTLEQHQASIMDLKNTRELLYQLQLLLDVPRKLRAAINQGAYDIAADIYADVSPVLTKHGHRKAFIKVTAEVEECRVTAAAYLRSQLGSSPENAVEAIQSISRLGESTVSLMDDFIGCQRKRLTEALSSAEAILEKSFSGVNSTPTDNNNNNNNNNNNVFIFNSFREALSQLNYLFLPELARTASLFAQMFDIKMRPKMVSEAREWFLRYISVVRNAIEKAATAAVASAVGLTIDGCSIAGATSSSAPGVTTSYVFSLSFSEDWGAENLVLSLDSVRADLIKYLEAPLRELSIQDKASELVGNAVRQHVTVAFSALEARVVVQLAELKMDLLNIVEESKESSGGGGGLRHRAQRGISELVSTALRGLEHAVRGVSQWRLHQWTLEGWEDVFSTLIQAHVSNWLRALPQRCLIAAGLAGNSSSSAIDVNTSQPFSKALIVNSSISQEGSTNTATKEVSPPPPLYFIALSVFCSSGHTRVADRAEELLNQQISGNIAPGWVGDAITASSAAGTKLLDTYKIKAAESLSKMVIDSVISTDWGTYPNARAPRPICSELIDALIQMDGDLLAAEQEAAVFGSGVGDGSAAQRGPHHKKHSTGSASMDSLMNVQGNFSIGNVAWTSRAEVIATALQAALHSQATALRKHTLSRAAFQQIQLDCHFLRPQVQRMVENTEVNGGVGAAAVAAIDEVLVVAAERCGEPVMLEPAMLDRMVSAYQINAQQQQQQNRRV
jgi:hypothetical protein